MRKRYFTGVALGIFLFVLVFISGCGGGAPSFETYGSYVNDFDGNTLEVRIVSINCFVLIKIINPKNETIIEKTIDNGCFKEKLSEGVYKIVFYSQEDNETRTSYNVKIIAKKCFWFQVDFTQPQDDKNL